MFVELCDDLILPSGGMSTTTLAQSHFRRKISQLNPLGFVIKIKKERWTPCPRVRYKGASGSLKGCSMFAMHTTYSGFIQGIYGPCQWKVYPNGKGKDPSRTGCILWNLRY